MKFHGVGAALIRSHCMILYSFDTINLCSNNYATFTYTNLISDSNFAVQDSKTQN